MFSSGTDTDSVFRSGLSSALSSVVCVHHRGPVSSSCVSLSSYSGSVRGRPCPFPLGTVGSLLVSELTTYLWVSFRASCPSPRMMFDPKLGTMAQPGATKSAIPDGH